MGKTVAQSKGNTGRRASQRNGGLPSGLKRQGASSTLPGSTNMLVRAGTLYELRRRMKLLRRWKCSASQTTDSEA